MKIIWHGHACFELISSEGSIVFDPYTPNYIEGLALPPLSADLYLCSHGHADHNCTDAVTKTGHVPTFTVSQFFTFHDDCMGTKRGFNMASIVETEGMRVLHCGDLGHMLTPEVVSSLGKIDVIMIPVGGTYTVDAKVAKEICDALKPAMIIPMHYKGDGIGLQSIAPVDDFAALFPEDMVEYLPTNELTVESIEKPCVKVFAWPSK